MINNLRYSDNFFEIALVQVSEAAVDLLVSITMRARDYDQAMAGEDNLERASSLGADGVDTFDEDARLRGSQSSTGAVNGGAGIKSRIRSKTRSKSSSRSDERPRRSRSVISSASASLSSIPNRITLSMLSSGLITISESIPNRTTLSYSALVSSPSVSLTRFALSK